MLRLNGRLGIYVSLGQIVIVAFISLCCGCTGVAFDTHCADHRPEDYPQTQRVQAGE